MKEFSVLLAKEEKKQKRISNIRRFFKKILSPLVKPLYYLLRWLQKREDEQAQKKQEMVLTSKDRKQLNKAFDRFILKFFSENEKSYIFFSRDIRWSENNAIDPLVYCKENFGRKISRQYYARLFPYLIQEYEHPHLEKFVIFPFREILKNYPTVERFKSYPPDSEEKRLYLQATKEWGEQTKVLKAAFPNERTPMFFDEIGLPFVAFRVKEEKN